MGSIPTRPTKISSDYLQSFLIYCKNRNLSPKTIDFYRQKLTQIQIRLPLLTATRQQIEEYLGRWVTTPGNGHAYLRALKAFYGWMLDSRYVDANPAKGIKIRVPKPLRYTLSLSAIPALLDHCSNDRDRLIVSILADTGLRLSELAGIGIGDIDPEHRVIKVLSKGAKERVVAYYGPTSAHYMALLLTQGHQQGDSLIGLEPRGIQIFLYRLGKETGIKSNAHSFRRLFATQSIRQGMNLFHVQSLLEGV